MGTSSNQPSPSTPGWQLANALLARVDVDPSAQARELWRAAHGHRGDELTQDLASPAVAHALAISKVATSPADAVREFERYLLNNNQAGLVLDLCKRALARTVATGKGASRFGGEFFSEITSYYVARDLPSFTAASDREPSIANAAKAKAEIRNSVFKLASSHSTPEATLESWREYVSNVLRSLKERS